MDPPISMQRVGLISHSEANMGGLIRIICSLYLWQGYLFEPISLLTVC